MKVTAENYESLKGFFGWMVENAMKMPPGLPPEGHPMAQLKIFEEKSRAIARQSLRIGIGDTLEATMDWSLEKIRSADLALAALNLPTLTTVKLEFSRKIAGILTRGRVRSEAEYYALRNVVEGMGETERATAWDILGAYELKRVAS
jgi:hypothetical protein